MQREMFTFQCKSCGQTHTGIPTFGWDYPVDYLAVPEAERHARCRLTSDMCVIDDAFFFVRGCLDIRVVGTDESFSWGVWASLSKESFTRFFELYDVPQRSQFGPFFGWLSAHIWIYPDTVNLKTMVHLRDNGARPYVEVEPTRHPLAVEQQNGISLDRVAEIYELIMHPPKT
jgi:hypothetical protein